MNFVFSCLTRYLSERVRYRGEGGIHVSMIPYFLDFIPCSPLIEPFVPKNVFSVCSLDPENFCTVPLIPKSVYHCSPYLFACFTFLFKVENIAFEPPHGMRLCCTSSIAVSAIPWGYNHKTWVGMCGPYKGESPGPRGAVISMTQLPL